MSGKVSQRVISKMTTKCLIFAYIILLWICIDMNCVLAINRDYKHNASLANQSHYDHSRDARQFIGGGYGSGLGGLGGASSYYGGLGSFGGPVEAIIIGLLVVFGLGIIGIPFLLLCMSFFNGNGFGAGGIGGSLVPTTTTTVGRKRRDINSLLPNVNPQVQQKLFNIFENFIESPDKMKIIENMIESAISYN